MDLSSIFVINNIDLLIIGISSAAIGIFGFDVFLSDQKNVTNRAFFLFALSNIFWSISNYFQYQLSDVVVIWATRVHLFITVWYCFSLLHLCYVLPAEKMKFSSWFKSVALFLSMVVSIIILTPLALVRITDIASRGQVSSFEHGIGMGIFVAFVVFLIMSSIILLSKKFYNASGIEKKQYKFLLIAVSVAFSLHVVFNLIFPAVFYNTSFIPFGILFSAIMIVFIGYAIFKYHLLNLKIIATEVIAFAISAITLFEVVQEKNLTSIVLRSIIFLLALIFSILLIKSVRREVEQREKIEELNKELERAYDVEKKANEELEKLDKIKNQFLLITQHNLRKPLTSMRGFLDILINGVLGRQNKKTIEGAKSLQEAVEDSIEEVGDFLNIAQFQMGKSAVDLKPDVNISPILDRIFKKLEIQADAKGIYLKLEKPNEPITIKADSVKLKAALSNIIDNAIKYTMKGGVEIKIENLNQKSVLIKIKDTGIGIPKDKLESIFETQFERTEQAKRTAEIGKGIGLYLSAQIIKSHDGKIWVESEGENKGSTFYIELPLGNSNE